MRRYALARDMASSSKKRIRHHSADSIIGQFIPLTNAYYTMDHKLAERDYSITVGAASELVTLFGLQLTNKRFTIEGQVRRSSTAAQYLLWQQDGNAVCRAAGQCYRRGEGRSHGREV